MPATAAPGKGPATDRKFVTALSRGLDVLRCFGPRDRWLTNLEMARRTGLAKPTVSRLAYTLTRLGYLRYSERLNKYALGSAAISLGYAALGQMDIRRVARPLMQELSDYTKASVHLAVNDRRSMQVVDTYWNAASFVNHPDRLKTPLVRRGDQLEPASWDEALALVAERLAAICARSGPDSLGFLASAKCTNEENYLLQKLARAVVKTNNVDHCARL